MTGGSTLGVTGSRRRKIPLLNLPRRSDAASEQHARHLGEELGVDVPVAPQMWLIQADGWWNCTS